MVKKRAIPHFKVLDWNFPKEDSRHFAHEFCWYPSRFIPIIPAHLIQALSKANELVLDPFCGVGTSLVEAIKLGRNAMGIEINPVGAFIAKTKAKVITRKSLKIDKIVDFRDYLKSLDPRTSNNKSLFSEMNKTQIYSNDELAPNFEENADWYHNETLAMLTHIYYYIESNFTGIIRDICKIFFISILMSSSGYQKDKNYAYYADNVKPKGEKTFKNAFRLYHHKLDRFYKHYNTSNTNTSFSQVFNVHNVDIRTAGKLVKKEVDLIVTSPPYLNVTDYATAFRLAYLWYDFIKNDEELAKLKRQEIGARWKRKKKNSLSEYIMEMEDILVQMSMWLRKNRYMCLVLGESRKFADVINNKIIELLTEKLNFELVDTFERDICKKFFIHPSGGGVQTEQILIFMKR